MSVSSTYQPHTGPYTKRRPFPLPPSTSDLSQLVPLPPPLPEIEIVEQRFSAAPLPTPTIGSSTLLNLTSPPMFVCSPPRSSTNATPASTSSWLTEESLSQLPTYPIYTTCSVHPHPEPIPEASHLVARNGKTNPDATTGTHDPRSFLTSAFMTKAPVIQSWIPVQMDALLSASSSLWANSWWQTIKTSTSSGGAGLFLYSANRKPEGQ